MKELKYYLHLYLSCECQFIASGSEERRIEYGLVVEKPLQGTEWGLINSEFEDTEVKCFAFVHDIKPILRPLIDMTEEDISFIFDAEKIVKFHLYGKRYLLITCNVFGNKVHTWIRFDRLSPQQFQRLLSKHFDLFGLIDSGLAIDKTKTP